MLSLAIESVPGPLDDIVIEFMMSQKRETAELDYKLTLDIRKDSDFAKIAKDMFAMSNYGGGYLVFGFRETETGSFEPAGLPTGFHIDQATIQEKFNSYSSERLAIGYGEIEKVIDGQKKKFAIIYIPPSKSILKPTRHGTYSEGGKVRLAFRKDEILFRRGTQSVKASLIETKFIEKRARDTEYKIGLLSGEPDKIVENLYSNFFKATKFPSYVYEAEIPSNIRFAFFETKESPHIRQADKTYSFCNLDNEPFKRYIRPESLIKHDTSEFLVTQDKRILLLWLLNTEIRYVALNRGLRYDSRNKNKYFYPTGKPERYEIWKGRYRSTRRLVAQRIYVRQLNRSVYVHDAAVIAFHSIGTDFYLNILPSIVLTHDGYETTQGFREGPVKTRLSYDKFNDAYLNLIFFWLSRFKAIDADEINFGGRIVVSSMPVTVSLDWGIMKDRPSTEFRDRQEELYSFEAADME